VVVVNPCYVFGAGDIYARATAIVRRFLLGRIPAYVDGALNVVDVQDVARGHLLADERGGVGERYILGNRNYTVDRLFADLARLSGVEAPALKLASGVALRLAQAAEVAPGRPPITVQEVRLASQWWTYRSTKAKRELGWTTSPHEDTIEATVAWYLDREGDRLDRARRTQPVTWKAAAAAMRAVEDVAGVAGRLWPLRKLSPWRSSTAARRPPTGSARAAGSRAACARPGSTSSRCACRSAGATATRSTI
jgi:dihydroflavonol-4-reductase